LYTPYPLYNRESEARDSDAALLLFLPTRLVLHLFIYVCSLKWKIAEHATEYKNMKMRSKYQKTMR